MLDYEHRKWEVPSDRYEIRAANSSRARAGLRALLEGFPTIVRRNRAMLMLRAYIDDSGSNTPPMFVLAGWVSRGELWETFSDSWSQALEAIPRINCFKMHDAHRLEGEFKGWAPEVRDAKLESLLMVIKSHAILGVHCAIPHAAYATLVSGKFARQVDRAYVVAFYMIMFEMISFLHLSKWNEPIDFVFDEQGIDAIYALAAYDVFLKFAPDELRPLIGSRPIHRSDSDIMPLQAADLIAWQTRRYYAEREKGKPYNNWVWHWINEKFGIVPYEVTRERIESIVQETKIINFIEGKVFPYEVRPSKRKRK